MRPIRYKNSARPLWLVLGLALLLASGCVVTPDTQAPTYDDATIKAEEDYQHTLAFKKRLKPIRRLQKISWPILEANVELCGDKVRQDVPLVFTQRSQVSPESRDGWTRVFGDTARPVVFAVLDPSLDDQVQEGWQVLSFDFTPSAGAETTGSAPSTGDGSRLKASFAAQEAGDTEAPEGGLNLSQLEEAVRGGGTLNLVLSDEQETQHELTLATVATCDYPVLLNDDDSVNAFADGRAIHINRGLMTQAPDDLTLAIVIGHELAHNSRAHIPAKITNTIIGGILGGILGGALDEDHIDTGIVLGAGLGGAAHSQAFENEADYVGLYHTARAGWDVSEAGDTWRWFGGEFPGMIGLRRGASHPSSVERYLNVDKTAQEIAGKLARGEPLIPGAGAGDGLDHH